MNEKEEKISKIPTVDKTGTIKNDFTTLKHILNHGNINKFESMDNRRLLSSPMVKKIQQSLLRGENPLGVLIINQIDGRWRLIDGNHRIEALKRFFELKGDPNLKIECVLRIYDNLSPEGERVIYTNEATRKNESPEDRLNLYKETITFWKLLQDPLNPFPCKVSIYSSNKSIKFKTVIEAIYGQRLSKKRAFSSRIHSKDTIVNVARSIGHEDFLMMRKFVEIFIKVFGQINNSNEFIKPHAFIPLYDIY